MGDVIIDGLTGANRLVILDANGKIPALDGSAVTALAGANFSSGTIPVARIDTGTTAGKVVKLDGNAKLPAVSGAALTGIVGATKNASDPTISTNPSGGVGTEWHNTTSGEVYVCTDATAGANVWTNVGGRSGDIVPYVFQGSSYGYCAGGYSWTAPIAGQNYIDRWPYTSDANAVDVGDLAVLNSSGIYTAPFSTRGASSSTYGYIMGGYWDPGANSSIEKVQLVATADGTDIGDLHTAVGNHHAYSDGTYAYCAGGDSATPAVQYNIIQSVAYASEVKADTTQNLTATTARGVAAQNLTHGYVIGGRHVAAATAVDVIERFQFATTNHSYDVGDMDAASVASGWGSSSLTHGYTAGGTTAVAATKINRIEKVQLVATANAVDIADILGNHYNFGSNSSTTHGYGFGREGATSTGSNEIQKFPFASDSNSTDVADLTVARMGSAGFQI